MFFCVCLNSRSSTTGGAATPRSILRPRFADVSIEFSFSSTLEPLNKRRREVIHLQPALFPLSVFLFPLVYPPCLSFPSSYFLNPPPFLFLFPTVLFFGPTLQLSNVQLFSCVLAEESCIYLHCSSLPGCPDAACNNSYISLFRCVVCVFKCLETTWRD